VPFFGRPFNVVFGERFAQALLAQIGDPWLRDMPAIIGSPVERLHRLTGGGKAASTDQGAVQDDRCVKIYLCELILNVRLHDPGLHSGWITAHHEGCSCHSLIPSGMIQSLS